MMQKVDHPAAWVGPELLQRPDWTGSLAAEEIEEISKALAMANEAGTALEDIDRNNFPLPESSKRLAEIGNVLEHGSGAFYLRGFPVDQFSLQDCERIFWGIARHLGVPVSQSADGKRLFHVSDAGFGQDDSRARGPNSNKGLRFHTDRCDVISFMCMRQAKEGGENYLTSSVHLHNTILERRPDLLEALYQPYIYERHNVDLGNRDPYFTQPVFAIHHGHFIANCLRVLIDRAQANPDLPDMTAKQMEALDYIDELAAMPEMHASFTQEPGDMLFVNNFVILHSRGQFTDWGDPEKKRLLLRLWLSVPNSRPLPELFAGMYIKTGAGEVRGGMRLKKQNCSK